MVLTNEKLKYYWKQGYIDPRIAEKEDLHRSTVGKKRRNKLELPVVREHSNSNDKFREGEMERGMVTVLHILRDKQPHDKQEVQEELTYLPEFYDRFVKLLKHNNFITITGNMITITNKGFDFYSKKQGWIYWKQQDNLS